MFKESVEINALFTMYTREVSNIQKSVDEARVAQNNMSPDNAAIVNIVCNQVESFISVFEDLNSKYIAERDYEIERLRDQIKTQCAEIEKYRAFTKAYSEENEELKMAWRDQSMLIARAAGLLDFIESRVEVIANSKAITKRMKDHRLSGADSPRYNHDIDNETLIKMYVESGYKLNSEIVNHFKKSSRGVSYVTLRDRLVKAGVWKGRQSDK